MRYKLLYLLAAFLGLTIEASAQKISHKSVAKAPVRKGLTLKQIKYLYSLEQMPLIDEYFTSIKWQFGKAQHTDSLDQVIYVHRNDTGISEVVYVFLCSTASNKSCAKPDYHTDNNQHIYQVMYRVPKSTFDVLQKEMRQIQPPTSSDIGDNCISTDYRYKDLAFQFKIKSSDDSPSAYYVIFGDVQPESK